MKYIMKVFCSVCFIILISSPGMTGLLLEKGMTPDEVETRFKTMKRQQQEIAREIWEEKQKKKEEAKEKEQLVKTSEVPLPLIPKEGKLSVQKEKVEGGEEGEEKVMPSPIQEEAKGLMPGVVTKEEKIQEAIKIEKRGKTHLEAKSKKTFSFILVIIVMLATIIFLIKSMSQGKPKDEKKGK